MADRFRSNGSAAYDIHYNNTARPIEQPEHLPDAPASPVKKVRFKLAISPFAVVGTMVAVVMMFLVIFSYVSMFEVRNEIAALESERAELQVQQQKLHSEYESSIDLAVIEERALAIGMRQPTSDQIRYLQIAEGDTTEVFAAPEERNILEQIYDAFCGVFRDAAEYFS